MEGLEKAFKNKNIDIIGYGMQYIRSYDFNDTTILIIQFKSNVWCNIILDELVNLKLIDIYTLDLRITNEGYQFYDGNIVMDSYKINNLMDHLMKSYNFNIQKKFKNNWCFAK